MKMKKPILTLLMAIFLCSTLSVTAAREPESTEVLIRFTHSNQCTSSFASDHGIEYVHTIPKINVHVYKVTNPEGLVTLPEVEFAEVNGTYEIYNIPNDPYWSLQANLPQINSVQGWQYSKGSPDVVIAILDTGIDPDHEDLKVIHHKNFTNDGLYDVNGHGTHVAGIAGGVTNNEIGIAGVNWYSSIMSVKVLGDSGPGKWDWIAEGIVYATDNGASVINMSLGASAASQTVGIACDYAYEHGVVIIASAGNNPERVGYPAAYESVIAVGAVTRHDQRADFSGTGNALELVAPGVSIWSTGLNNTYRRGTGTSMAAPHVAGLAGLILSKADITPEQVRKAMIRGADDLGTPGYNEEYGYGRINVYNTLKPPQLKNGIYLGGNVLTYYTWGQFSFGDPELRDQIADETTQAGFSNLHVVENGKIANLRDIINHGYVAAQRDFIPGDLEEEYADTEGNPIYPPQAD